MDQNKKYRYTKQLINMALRDGWTQTSIAEACRTQQSIVSKWKSGATQAKENQLTKLLEIYGPKLRRQSFKIYHDLIIDAQDKLIVQMIKVEGNVLLTFPYSNSEFCSKCLNIISDENKYHNIRCRCSSSVKKQMPKKKLIFHIMGKGEFCVVHQERLLKTAAQMKFPETNIFRSNVIGQWNVEDLLKFVDDRFIQDTTSKEPDRAEHLMLQMLIRKALLENGYPVEGVEEHLVS